MPTPYFATEQLQARLGAKVFLQLFDLDQSGSADAARLEDVRLYAEAMVNAYLRKSHDVPFATEVPRFIADIAIDLAIGRAFELLPGAQKSVVAPQSVSVVGGMPAPNGFVSLHDRALARLKQLGSDEGPRIGANAPEPVVTGDDIGPLASTTRTFFGTGGHSGF